MRAAVRLAWLLLPVLAACGEEPRSPEGPSRQRYDAEGRYLEAHRPPARLPNLVLVIVDTLRADALRADGSGSDAPGPAVRMPFLESLAAAGVSLSDATAPAPWTLPSITSLLTGLLPTEHGLNDSRHQPFLPEIVTTFAEVLSRGWGYDTAAFTAGAWFSPRQGILQGFGTVQLGFGLAGTAPMVGPWIQRRDPSRPFFLMLHTFDVHDPYGERNHPWPQGYAANTPLGLDASQVREPWEMTRWFLLDNRMRRELANTHGPGFLDRVIRYMTSGFAEEPRPRLAEELSEAYWDGARWADGLLAETVAYLRAQGLLEDTLLVVCGDHGEAFGEHGILGHGRSLHDELVRIPLVMTGPEPFAGGRAVPGGVGLLDVLPTFLDWAGIPPPDGQRGRSFLPLLRGEGGGRPVISQEHLHRNNTGSDVDVDLLSVRSPRWKYVLERDRTTEALRERLFDLAADPGERYDLAAPAGRLPRETAFDDDFCATVEEVRALLRSASTPAAASSSAPLPPCR